MTDTQLRGTKENPFHLSIGQVLFNNQNKIALIRKTSGLITLPRETIFLNESIQECIMRGAKEEIGVEISISRFLGSQISSFPREDASMIEKTTLYFKTHVEKALERKQLESDEIEDKVIWRSMEEAINLLKSCNNLENEIVQRI